MNSLYPSYIRAFAKFSKAALDKRSSYKSLSRFAIVITLKANELVKRAELNRGIDSVKLHKEINKMARQYIRSFGEMSKKDIKENKELKIQTGGLSAENPGS